MISHRATEILSQKGASTLLFLVIRRLFGDYKSLLVKILSSFYVNLKKEVVRRNQCQQVTIPESENFVSGHRFSVAALTVGSVMAGSKVVETLRPYSARRV